MTLVADVNMSDMPRSGRKGGSDVVLGEDWDRPAGAVEAEIASARERRGFFSLNRSPLARKIITFNLIALLILVSGILFLNPSQDALIAQRERGLVVEAQLLADVVATAVQQTSEQTDGTLFSNELITPQEPDFASILDALELDQGSEVRIFDGNGDLLASAEGTGNTEENIRGLNEPSDSGTIISDGLNWVWEKIEVLRSPVADLTGEISNDDVATAMANEVAPGETLIRSRSVAGERVYTVITPVEGETLIALTTTADDISALVRTERERVLQMFVLAILVSIGLSMLLASTIANPLSDLSAAAELGRDKHARKMSPQRVRIPDLTARPDEIGRLSGALRGMVAALYDRIDSNEQFAADVAHEIKNPLASLRSAVGTLRVAKNDDQRTTLLDVIDHDVRRLDRLVSDISNASRLDSELVKEDEEAFDLVKMLTNLAVYHSEEAETRSIDFISDLPKNKIEILGLEARLAQVFVNLISNALSFCSEGDAVRVWARKRDNRVLVVVEDTGPGIPEQALTKVFNRFYSERPNQEFGNHSGLGLAISKQIVEAHGGVIWAENIRPTDADITSDPLGARFVVGLPI